ncbi:hypothetical protein AAFC00_005116 [Neodothiora populina]|uniref:Amino acid transporter n=1 Tax=Neodothiora populina TaxID=2781224 RepID=A0ABR3PK21_9PEZI
MAGRSLAPPRDSLELASLASSQHSARSSVDSSSSGAPSSRRLSFSDDADDDLGGERGLTSGRPTNRHARSYSVSSAFDFAPALFPLSTSGAGYTAIGAPAANGLGAEQGSLEKHKSLTLWKGGLSLVVGLIIGSGIFSSPAQVNINAGAPGAALLIWFIAGLLAWTGAASYAELGGAIPLNGGPQVYLSKIYGEWAGFLFTWCAVVVLKPGSAAIIALIFGEYFVRAIIGADAVDASVWINKAVAVFGLVLVTFLNCLSTKVGTRSTDVFVVLKFVALAGVTITGIIVAITGWHYHDSPPANWKSPGYWTDGTKTDPSSWAVALYAGLWAYDGWDNVNYVTGEFVNPKRDLPRTIHTSLALVVLSYLLANVAYFFVLPLATINSSNTVAVAFGHAVLGPIGSFLLALVVCGSCFGSLNATAFTSGRLVYAAGKEGFLPAFFGRLGFSKDTAARLPMRPSRHSRWMRLIADDAGFFYTPAYAMILNAGMTMIYVIIGDFTTLTTFYGVAGYTFYFFTVLGLIVLRVKEPDLERPYRCWITTPVIFCCVSLFLLSRAVFAQPLQTLIVVAFIVAGVPLYFWRMRGRNGQMREALDWKFWKRWGRHS